MTPAVVKRRVPGRPRWRLARGFTLIELLIVIAITAILLGLAAPSFSDASLSGKLSANANRLSASAMLARSEAIKRNVTITMCVSTDSATCAGSSAWEQGWIVVNLSTATVLQVEPAAPAGLKITDAAAATTLTFPSTGAGTTNAVFKVCRLTPSLGTQERSVTVSATGRTTVTKTTLGTCP